MNLRCYYFAAGSYILEFKEALLEVADIKRRDGFIAEWKYTDLFCAAPISGKLKHCNNNLQFALKFLYISVLL